MIAIRFDGRCCVIVAWARVVWVFLVILRCCLGQIGDSEVVSYDICWFVYSAAVFHLRSLEAMMEAILAKGASLLV